MKQNKISYIVEVIIFILLLSTIIYQMQTNKKIQEELENINTDLETHQSVLTTISSEVSTIKTDVNKQFQKINEKIQISSSQIDTLQEDISNIQVQSKDFSSIVDNVLPAVVSVIADRSQGSGVIISDDGYIVTNYHVIEEARRIRVLTYDKEVYDAEVIGTSQDADIALLKIDETDLNYLEFGDSDDIRVGERGIALGNPAGLSFSVTEGIVSATDRVGPNGIRAYLQVDVPINPGNSGGPLVNIQKEIIGINNFKIGGSFEALGFAIESNYVEDIVDKIFEELEKQTAQEP